MGTCDPGLKESRHLKVTKQHCADMIGSGDVPVLGTPAILTLAEGACIAAICDDLPEGRPRSGRGPRSSTSSRPPSATRSTRTRR